VPVHQVDIRLAALCSQAGFGRLPHQVCDSYVVKTAAMTPRGAAASLAASITALSALTACSGWSSSINVADAGGHRLLAHTRTPSGAASASLHGPLTLNSDFFWESGLAPISCSSSSLPELAGGRRRPSWSTGRHSISETTSPWAVGKATAPTRGARSSATVRLPQTTFGTPGSASSSSCRC